MRPLTATLLLALTGALAFAGSAVAAPVTVKAESDPGGPAGDPSVAVDDAGTAHVAYGYQNADGSRLVGYCRLPRGATACEAGRVFPVDVAGTAPVVIRYQAPSTIAFVIQECCEATYGPGTAQTVAFVSTDGGSTFGARDKLAPGAPGAGGEGAVDPHDAILVGGRFGWVNSTSTSGHRFQSDALGAGPVTARADIFAGGHFDAAVGLVDAASFSPLVVSEDSGGPLGFRRLSGGDPNAEASWTPEAPIDGQGEEPELAEGPAGLFLAYGLGDPGRQSTVVRRFDGTSFGGAVNTGLAYGDGNDIAQDDAGHLYAVADDNRDIKLAISRDAGATWSPSPNVATGESGSGNIHIGHGVRRARLGRVPHLRRRGARRRGARPCGAGGTRPRDGRGTRLRREHARRRHARQRQSPHRAEGSAAERARATNRRVEIGQGHCLAVWKQDPRARARPDGQHTGTFMRWPDQDRDPLRWESPRDKYRADARNVPLQQAVPLFYPASAELDFRTFRGVVVGRGGVLA